MTPDLSLSVVVASLGRPGALRRCLSAVSQSTTNRLEAIVVADKAGLEAVATLPFAHRLKTVLQAEPNLAQARNDGIAQAAGDVIAFLDDDAVPEPTWAGALLRAFGETADIAAATGPVIGRNGISLQWGPVAVDREGRDHRLGSDAAQLPDGTCRKLHGTNMAIRRDVLVDLGGFDPAFRYYLDDTDLALRLADRGHRMDWVDGAQVHHAFAASSRRTQERVPLSLHDIGASTALFLRKHAPDQMENALARLAEDQRARLFRLARRRKLGPREIENLMADLRDGIADGRRREIGTGALRSRGLEFRPLLDTPSGPDILLVGRRIMTRRARAEAERLTDEGARVTLLLMEPTIRAHTVRYTDGGWWEQTGGLFGRSLRDAPRLQLWRISARAAAETARISVTRFGQPPQVRFIDR